MTHVVLGPALPLRVRSGPTEKPRHRFTWASSGKMGAASAAPAPTGRVLSESEKKRVRRGASSTELSTLVFTASDATVPATARGVCAEPWPGPWAAQACGLGQGKRDDRADFQGFHRDSPVFSGRGGQSRPLALRQFFRTPPSQHLRTTYAFYTACHRNGSGTVISSAQRRSDTHQEGRRLLCCPPSDWGTSVHVRKHEA